MVYYTLPPTYIVFCILSHPSTYTVFCILSHIIKYNVYFFYLRYFMYIYIHEIHMCFLHDRGKSVIFLNEGKMVIIILKPQIPTFFSLVDRTPYCWCWIPNPKAKNPKETNASLTLMRKYGIQ